MKVLSVSVSNFSSYESLTFTPSDQGLCLVQGPTGAGKSTLCDVIPWVLFGRTAKGGGVDEVVSWNAKGSTNGEIVVEINGVTKIITRSRKPNDLAVHSSPEDFITRGKDLADTQRMINELIGMDYDLYLASSYYHEFSQTAQFFTANAKSRRAIFEQLTDLSLADKLTDESAASKKELKALKTEMTTEHQIMTTRHKDTKNQWATENDRRLKWEVTTAEAKAVTEAETANFEEIRATAIKRLTKMHKNFETSTQAEMKELEEKIDATKLLIKPDADLQAQKAYIQGQIDHLRNDKCPTCGSAKGSDRVMLLTKDLYNLDKVASDNRARRNDIVNYTNQWKKISNQSNPFTQSLQDEINRKPPGVYLDTANPYIKRCEELNERLYELGIDIEQLNDEIKSITVMLTDLELLNDVISTYRASSLKNTVKTIESTTNDLLVKYFDAEIKVTFEAMESDKLDVGITKDGNEAQYTQLSKGQRCLLKLCFGISVMKQVAQAHAITVNSLWFDEALDGLSDDLKMKSLRLLESLALDYNSVFVVEHSSVLKAAFNNSITVIMENGRSSIEEA